MAYQSGFGFESERVHAAAVYCSDGRFGDHCDEFLHHHLNLPNYDRVAVPGGPGAFAGHQMGALSARGLERDIGFLIEAHSLRRVILIAHAGCAFYIHRLRLEPGGVWMQQKADLELVASRLRSAFAGLTVESYLAWPTEEGVGFGPVTEV